MIKIVSYAKAKNGEAISSIGGGNSGGYANNPSKNNNTSENVNGVMLWGNYHDHTKDIDGPIKTPEISADKGNIDTLNSREIHNEENIYTKDLLAENIDAESANIKTIKSQNIETDNLIVHDTFKAFRLIIDEVESVGGQLILSPANCELVFVDSFGTQQNPIYHKCYFLAKNDKQISNPFRIGDMIICQTFNLSKGENFNVQNRFYWMTISEVSDAPEELIFDGVKKLCHSFKVDTTDPMNVFSNSNAVPEIGDKISVLGSKIEPNRQNAIIISSQTNSYLSKTIKGPSIVQYAGINDYHLDGKELNIISNGLNSFKGDFISKNGENIISVIQNTANHIRLALGRTGIDIINGKIHISADNTEIHGNLNLYDNKNNGLTIFDDEDKARVNLQADSIKDMIDFNDHDRVFFKNLSKSEYRADWNVFTESYTIMCDTDQTVVDITNIKVNFSARGNKSMVYPQNRLRVDFRLVEVDTNKVSSKTVELVKRNNVFVMNHDDMVRLYANAKQRQAYILTAKTVDTVGSLEQGTFVSLSVDFQLSISNGIQTFIGKDGMFSHISGGKYFILSPDEIVMRQGFGGLRLSIPKDNDNLIGKFEVIGGTIGDAVHKIPYFVSAYNYTPMKVLFPSDFKANYITNIGETKINYRLKVEDVYGNISIYKAPQNTHGDAIEPWIVLPKTLQTNGSEDYYAVPLGYHITIYNNMIRDKKSVNVTGYFQNKSQVKFIGPSMNVSDSFEITIFQNSATFTYVGTNLMGNEAQYTDYWMVS